MANSTEEEETKKNLVDHKTTKSYLKYSGLAFQMASYVIVGLLIGKQLDKYFELEKPILTAGCMLLFLVAYFIKLFNDINQGRL